MKAKRAQPQPQLILLGGPNGAGKSTFYEVFLRHLQLPFLNADLLEARTGIPSLEAARILDATRDLLIDQRAGFITETVFSDPMGAKVGMLQKAVDDGYAVTLIYVAVVPELSAHRVDQRVAAGGHDVPRDRIASRFERSLGNLRLAIPFVPVVKVYDNSSMDDPYRLLAVFQTGKCAYRAPGQLPAWAEPIVTGKSPRKAKRSTRAR